MRYAFTAILRRCARAGWSPVPVGRGNVVTGWADIVLPAIGAAGPPPMQHEPSTAPISALAPLDGRRRIGHQDATDVSKELFRPRR